MKRPIQLVVCALAACVETLVAQVPEHGPFLQRARSVWFTEGQNPIGAEVGISFEPLPWNDDTKAAWAAAPGTRIALSGKAWAEFATFTELRFGGVVVKSGTYYAVLERTKEGLAFGLLDAAKIRARQMEPGAALGQPLVAAVPLGAGAGPGGPLGVEFVPDESSGSVTMLLSWGPHTLRATASVQGGKGGSAIAMPDARQASRLAWPAKDGRTPIVAVDHGVLPWSDEMEKHADALAVGQRWRLGKDWATTLDTNAPLVVGDKKLSPGLWHLTMEKTKAGWSLAISSAADDYARKLDGFAADHTSPVVVAPLQEDPDRIKSSDLLVLFQSHEKKHRLVISAAGQQWFVPVALGK